ncbi:MAG: hypothetical protein GWO24_26500, partial [Akkermansiaceae bacterium]|nr:hypothetical protein [Akkermansiaceae bacterium]
MRRIQKESGPQRDLAMLSGLEELRNFEGAPTAFWRAFLKTLVEIAGAGSGVVVIRGAEGTWKGVAVYPRSSTLLADLKKRGLDLAALTLRASEEGAV